MVETDTPKVSAISRRGIPRSTAASTLSLRSFEYALMPTLSHGFNTQASRCERVWAATRPERPAPTTMQDCMFRWSSWSSAALRGSWGSAGKGSEGGEAAVHPEGLAGHPALSGVEEPGDHGRHVLGLAEP